MRDWGRIVCLDGLLVDLLGFELIWEDQISTT